MLTLLKQYRMYLAPFAVSCSVHYGVMQFGSGSADVPPALQIKHGESPLNIKLLPSIASSAALKSSPSKTSDVVSDTKNTHTESPAGASTNQVLAKPDVPDKSIDAAAPESQTNTGFKVPENMLSDLIFPLVLEPCISPPDLTRSISQTKPHTVKPDALHKMCSQQPEPPQRPSDIAHQPMQQQHVSDTPEQVESIDPSAQPSPVNSVDSIEQDADMKEPGAVVAAQPTSQIVPRYPRTSRRKGEEGAVQLLIHINTEGSVRQVEILTSSGYDRLDRAAVKSVQSAQFSPELHNGSPQSSALSLTIRFKLDDVL